MTYDSLICTVNGHPGVVLEQGQPGPDRLDRHQDAGELTEGVHAARAQHLQEHRENGRNFLFFKNF